MNSYYDEQINADETRDNNSGSIAGRIKTRQAVSKNMLDAFWIYFRERQPYPI